MEVKEGLLLSKTCFQENPLFSLHSSIQDSRDLEVPVTHLLALGAELSSQHKDTGEVLEPLQDCVTKAAF